MKKILLGTTAVVALASLSTEAFAADPIALKLGGFMRHYVGYVNHDEVAAAHSGVARTMNLAQFANSEVYFRGSTTLDNGLKVSVDIQREADKSTAARNDVSALTVSSDALGALTIGSTTHAVEDLRTKAPNAGNHDWTDLTAWAAMADTTTTSSASYTDASTSMLGGNAQGGKDGKLKYLTPTFSGVTAFATYSAAEGSGASDARRLSRNATEQEDGYDYGLTYNGEVSGAKVQGDLTHVNLGNRNYEYNRAGLSVGMSGFTVGGAYADFNDTATASSARDGNAWEAGLGYKTGPYTMTASYYAAKDKGTTAATGDNKDKKWMLAATYDMGAGVKLTGTYFNQTRDGENTVANPTTSATGKAMTTNGVIAGIEVGF